VLVVSKTELKEFIPDVLRTNAQTQEEFERAAEKGLSEKVGELRRRHHTSFCSY